MPPIDALEALGNTLQGLMKPEILILLIAAAALIAYLGVRRARRRSKTSTAVEETKTVKVFAEENGRVEEKTLEPEPPHVQARALEALKSKGTLRPSPLAADEGGHYPDIIGAASSEVIDALRGLVERGLASEGDIEFSAVTCPICGSCSQVALISCKNCGSLRVQEVKYLKHACGFIGPESSFRNGDLLRCPQCNSTEGIEIYHKRYYCPDCRTESNEVNISFKCGSCGALYDESNMELKPFRKFELSKEGLENYEKIIKILNEQLMKLKAQGYTIERPATLVGESGVAHTFEAVARKGYEKIAIAISLGGTLTETLFRLGVAKSDLKFKKLILITSKTISPVERDFARSLGIELIGAT